MNSTVNNGTSSSKKSFLFISIPFSMNMIVGFPTNTYVLWLMAKGGRESLATDFFALQLTLGEFLNFFSLCTIYCIFTPVYTNDENLDLDRILGFALGLVYGSRPVFQCLMCLERYLAVMKPLVFKKYRPLRYKVASASLCWLLVSAYCCSCVFTFTDRPGFFASCVLFVAFLFVKLFCGLAILRALKSPGPGDRNRDKEREGTNVKMRAFKTILLSGCASMLSEIPMIAFMVWNCVTPGDVDTIKVFIAVYVCVAVTGYVQPCLYLHRMGKLPCAKP